MRQILALTWRDWMRQCVTRQRQSLNFQKIENKNEPERKQIKITLSAQTLLKM